MNIPSPSSASSDLAAMNEGVQSSMVEIQIPAQLKFLMNNVKSVVHTHLTPKNHPIWRAQILKVFTANGYAGFLDGTTICPSKYLMDSNGSPSPNPNYAHWMLVDQNLSAALYSVISTSLLPYVLNLDTCHQVWLTVEKRLQATNRSRVLQLKNELHHLTMKDQSMTEYLSTVKSKVDAIQATGSSLDPEDIILYTLNELPASYHAFKTSIRTSLQPISLDDLYSLLCSEEVNIAAEAVKELNLSIKSESAVALYASRGRGRTRGNLFYNNRGRGLCGGRFQNSSTGRGRTPVNSNMECQICKKRGHSAVTCWYRGDFNYKPATPQIHAYSATTGSPNSTAPLNSDWYLDSGASSHFTSTPSQFTEVQPYQGIQQVTVGNGQNLPISATGQGILPTPTRKLLLKPIYHVPKLKHNLHHGSQPRSLSSSSGADPNPKASPPPP